MDSSYLPQYCGCVDVKHSYSLLIKKLLQIRNELASSEIAAQRLAGWFEQGGEGVTVAYDHFEQSTPRKPWALTVWKIYVQSSHLQCGSWPMEGSQP